MRKPSAPVSIETHRRLHSVIQLASDEVHNVACRFMRRAQNTSPLPSTAMSPASRRSGDAKGSSGGSAVVRFDERRHQPHGDEIVHPAIEECRRQLIASAGQHDGAAAHEIAGQLVLPRRRTINVPAIMRLPA